MNKEFPKVLIVGQTFSGFSGSAITMRNLFKNWPKEKIAVTSNNIINDQEGFKFCENYYRLGDKEIIVFPFFNLIFSPHKSKIIYKYKEKSIEDNLRKINTKIYYSILKNILIKTGLYFVRFKYNISNEFKEWLYDFKPQVIYSAIGDIALMKFIIEIKELLNVPLVIHIWDDWVHSFPRKTILKAFWVKKINKDFNKILNVADLLLSISDEMANEYKKLYDKEFITFHNPVDLKIWENTKRYINNETDIKIILYTGKINDDTKELLLRMANIVENYKIDKRMKSKIIFHIYSPDYYKQYKFFNRYEKTKLFPPLPHDQIIEKLKNASILFLPLGFSQKSIKYTRLSMPTKLSEYMASNVPIILMAPPELAVTKYARKFKFAEVVDEENTDKLLDSIYKLLTDHGYSKNITRNAIKLATEKHSIQIINKNFIELLIKVSYSEK